MYRLISSPLVKVNMTQSKLRRIFLLRSLVTATGVIYSNNTSLAAEKLNPSDAAAREQFFSLNTENVDREKNPRHNFRQLCKSCKYWNGGVADFGNCAQFGEALTPKEGWCRKFQSAKT